MTGTGGELGQAAADPAAPQNWAQDARQWYKRQTNTGVVDFGGGVQLDPGRVGADMLPSLAISPAVKKITGKGPGFLPATFALDGLDLVGANPLTDRFGQGAMGLDEATQKGEQTAGASAPMRALSGLTQPLTTLYSGVALADDADKQMAEAAAANTTTADALRRQSLATGKAPSLSPMTTGDYTYARNPDGSIREKTTWEQLKKVHQNAWRDSYVPGVNYVEALADSWAQNQDAIDAEHKQRDVWREWARNRDQQLAAAKADPAQAAAAEAEQAKLREEQAKMKSTTRENLDRNFRQRSFVHPFRRDFWRGNWHMPWSSDVD